MAFEIMNSPETGWLPELAVKEMLAARGVAVRASREAVDVASAVAAAGELEYPIVLKLSAPELVHKSDLGGVVLGLETSEAVADAADGLLAIAEAAGLDGAVLIVEEQQPAGLEL